VFLKKVNCPLYIISFNLILVYKIEIRDSQAFPGLGGSILISVTKKKSGKLIHQPVDFPQQFILSLRTTPDGEAISKNEIAALRPRRPLASGWLPNQHA
jgi:hypothetical protein